MPRSIDHFKGDASRPPGKPQKPAQSKPSTPPQWLNIYGDFITKNAHQVSQIESALRSLTYIIPGRFRDAEIASETLHSGIQLLSLYHDAVLRGAVTKIPALASKIPSPHTRYTRFWTGKSRLYRRIALLLQIVQYTELLWEMAAKRKGEKVRWRVIILLEAIKAFCRLLLMRVTNSRPLVTPPLPEREPIPPEIDENDDAALKELMGEDTSSVEMDESAKSAHEKEWTMPRTGASLPSLPNPGDISSYLMSRVLTADDIKPAAKLLNTLSRSGQTAEILHILAPLVYAIALSRSKNKKSWTPWILGFSMEYAARQLRDRGLRSTALENEEWGKRYWAAGWWIMRGAFYEHFTKGLIDGVRRRMPSLVAGILEDYQYLWDNYYFSTSP
ncbi:peroxisome membrane protein [Daldinia vernicosa]|uniref:peroxisome membrane protein n=1 Tax=Daldinia vernicosa TaxID=114800 RepID=UPI0020086620|nr:peroxisome membrane protein [Daldinia vernicosa]KAI0850714.1 peroxisome membrane protein [Daldinia vernicosa]